jgi:hypothetical protein
MSKKCIYRRCIHHPNWIVGDPVCSQCCESHENLLEPMLYADPRWQKIVEEEGK